MDEIKLLPVSETNGCHIGILFSASIFIHSHWHVILHMPAKFRSNQTIGGGVMTSYRFFKTAATESELYFGVKI